MSKEEFVQIIRDKYPMYKDVDDDTLYQAAIGKYPEYRKIVDMKQTNFSDVIPNRHTPVNNVRVVKDNTTNTGMTKGQLEGADVINGIVSLYIPAIGIADEAESIASKLIGKKTAFTQRLGTAADEGRPDRALSLTISDFTHHRVGQGLLSIATGLSSKFWQPALGIKTKK